VSVTVFTLLFKNVHVVDDTKQLQQNSAHPLTAADLWFVMPKTLFFLYFFFARPARDLGIILIEIRPKHAKNDFYFNLYDFMTQDPPPVGKVHAP